MCAPDPPDRYDDDDDWVPTNLPKRYKSLPRKGPLGSDYSRAEAVARLWSRTACRCPLLGLLFRSGTYGPVICIQSALLVVSGIREAFSRNAQTAKS